MAAFAGLRGTGDWGTDERPKNFREYIQWTQPNGDTPLLALTSRMKKGTTDDPEFSWWSEPMDIVRLQVAGALNTTDSVVTIDSGDPDSKATYNRVWGSALHLKPGDILLVEPSTDSATYNHEQVLVTAVHSATQFSIQRGFAGTTAAAISDNTYLTLIGSAYEEGSGEPNSNSRNPVKDFNYTQIFKTAYEVTNTANATRARTGNVLNNDKKRKSFDHARAIEQAMFWGARSESVGPNNKPLRTMGGIRQSIPADNTTILGANWGMVNSASAGNNFLDALEPIFSFASGAGDERVAFCGIPVMNAINRAIAENSGAAGFDLQLGSKEKVWGMNFQEILLPQGRLLLKRHPLMSRHALYKYSMFLLDFSNIEYVSLKGRDTKEKDNIQTKGEDVVRGMWQSEVSLCVKQMGQTQGYIGGFNQDPA